MIWLTITEYAKKHNVSKQRVSYWIENGRLHVYRPRERVVLIDAKQPRPSVGKPGRPKLVDSVN